MSNESLMSVFHGEKGLETLSPEQCVILLRSMLDHVSLERAAKNTGISTKECRRCEQQVKELLHASLEVSA